MPSVLTARYAGNRTISIDTAEPSPPAPGEVQVRVAFTGLCGTDLHILHGNMDARVSTPLIFGHEMSGTIESVGDGVTGWSPGDAVTVMPLDWDGTCPACLAGNSHICQNLNFIGIDSPGSLQQLWNVPAEVLVALPAGLRLDHAALVEPVAVAVHDVRRAQLAAGQKAVVIGGGPIGVLIATVAREFGGDVVVIELDAGRRAQIDALGFTTIDPIADRPGRLGRGVDWRRRRRCRVRGLRCRQAVLGATALAKVRGTIVVVAIHPCRGRSTCSACSGASCRSWGRGSTSASTSRPRSTCSTGAASRPTCSSPRSCRSPRPLAAFDDLENGRAMKILVDVGRCGMTGPFDLTGTTAVVTGASRGIGFAMAEALAAAGADIIGVSAHARRAGSAIEAAVTRARAIVHRHRDRLRGSRRGRRRSPSGSATPGSTSWSTTPARSSAPPRSTTRSTRGTGCSR